MSETVTDYTPHEPPPADLDETCELCCKQADGNVGNVAFCAGHAEKYAAWAEEAANRPHPSPLDAEAEIDDPSKLETVIEEVWVTRSGDPEGRADAITLGLIKSVYLDIDDATVTAKVMKTRIEVVEMHFSIPMAPRLAVALTELVDAYTTVAGRGSQYGLRTRNTATAPR